jgi:hypothetical protein
MTNKLKRTGNCFDDSANRLLNAGPCSGLILVHGLPHGTGGEAAKAGHYPHAWIEYRGMCWDPNREEEYPKDFYYAAGHIEYTKRYTLDEAKAEMVRVGTYGPWDQTILDRDAEIDNMRA